jgi:hypothetical protein
MTQVQPTGPPNNVFFWRCLYCGLAIFTTGAGPGTPPVCVDGTTMTQVTDKVPTSLMAVVWRNPRGA